MLSATKGMPWTRRAAWGGAILLAVVLVTGLVLLLIGRFAGSGEAHEDPSSGAPHPTHTSGGGGTNLRAIENKIANRPMPKGKGIQRQMEVNATTEPLELPEPTKMIDGIIASGFPMTPAGAVAQLAALEKAAYHDFNVDRGRHVHDLFAMDGAVPVSVWGPTATVMQYFTDNPDSNPGTMRATYTPVQGMIKGTADGGRFAVVCTLGRLTYSENGDSNTIGAPDCARMRWHEGRWMIAPGADPAPPPWTWPRSKTSYEAEFRDLTGWQSS